MCVVVFACCVKQINFLICYLWILCCHWCRRCVTNITQTRKYFLLPLFKRKWRRRRIKYNFRCRFKHSNNYIININTTTTTSNNNNNNNFARNSSSNFVITLLYTILAEYVDYFRKKNKIIINSTSSILNNKN